MWFGATELKGLDLRAGDVVVVEGGQGGFGRAALMKDDLPGVGFQNSINRIRANKGVDPRFLTYCLLSARTAGYLHAYCDGASMPHLTAEKLGRLRLPTPGLADQIAVADFLDNETAKIDALIEKQLRLAAALTDRVDAAWGRAYQQLSGEEVMVSRLITSIVDGPFGSALTSAHYADSGTRVIRLGNVGVNEFRNGDEAYVSSEYGRQLDAHEARPGDVVMAGLGDERMPLGRAAVVPDNLGPAIVKADCYRLRPRIGLVTPGYLSWALSSPPVRAQIAQLARGATRARLNTGIAKAVRIKVPLAGEQGCTVNAWTEGTDRADAVIQKVTQSISVARERRSALITAAVTGQLDVGKVT